MPVLQTKIDSLPLSITQNDDSFYSDSEVKEMMRVENLLNHCDQTEFDMLYSLIDGVNYFKLAEKHHMSVNGAKYKLRKLFDLCNVNSKSEFVELIKKYIY